jgi:hypothetical protein
MTTIKLTDAQRQVLEHAADQPDGRIAWFPHNIKGGARQKVIEGLSNRGLVTGTGMFDCCISAAGHAALGREQPSPAPITPIQEIEANEAVSEVTVAPDNPPVAEDMPSAQVKPKRSRENCKQAIVLQMLRRPEGATIANICETTGWLGNTTRGFLAGSVKKKLGLTLTSIKPEKCADRIYHLPA